MGRVADWPIHINKPIGTVLAGFGATFPRLVREGPSLLSFEAFCTAVGRSLHLRNLNQQWVEVDDRGNVSLPEHAPLASASRRYTRPRRHRERLLHNRSGRSRNGNQR